MNRVVLHCDVHGRLDRIASDEPLEIMTICEAAPDDRVYKRTPGAGDYYVVSKQVVDTLIGESQVRSFFDDDEDDKPPPSATAVRPKFGRLQ